MADRSTRQTTRLRGRTGVGPTLASGGLVGAAAILLLAVAAGRIPVGGTSTAGARPSTHPFASPAGPSPTTAAASVSPTATPAAPARRPALIPLPIHGATADPRLLYDASPDGTSAAYRDQWSGPGALHLLRAHGPVVDLNLGPTDLLAPQAAAFSPDGRMLAVVDGAGALWTVDVASATPTRVATSGPFGRSVRFGDAQHLYVQVVGSVEIPIPSHIAVVHLADGAVTILADDPAAFGPRPLDDGSVAYLHLNDDGTYVARRLGPSGVVTDIAQVGFAHGGVDVSWLGAVAFSDGATTQLVTEAGALPRTLGAGASPRFARDGLALAVYAAAHLKTELLGLDGTPLGSSSSPFVAVVACREGC
jgi:hypothetical protein